MLLNLSNFAAVLFPSIFTLGILSLSILKFLISYISQLNIFEYKTVIDKAGKMEKEQGQLLN